MISFFYLKALRNPVMYRYVNSRPRLKPWRTQINVFYFDNSRHLVTELKTTYSYKNFTFGCKCVTSRTKPYCRVIKNPVSFIQYYSMNSIDLRDYFLTRLYSVQSKPKQIGHIFVDSVLPSELYGNFQKTIQQRLCISFVLVCIWTYLDVFEEAYITFEPHKWVKAISNWFSYIRPRCLKHSCSDTFVTEVSLSRPC